MVSTGRDHWQARSDKRSSKPAGGFIRPQSRRLLLNVRKFRQSIRRIYERRTYRQIGRRRHVLLHAEHAGTGRGHGGRGQRTRVRFIPEVARSVSGQVSTRSLVSENTFWEELKLDSSASSTGGNDNEDQTENPLG